MITNSSKGNIWGQKYPSYSNPTYMFIFCFVVCLNLKATLTSLKKCSSDILRSNFGETLGAFISKLLMESTSDADLKDKTERLSNEIQKYEVLVSQLKVPIWSIPIKFIMSILLCIELFVRKSMIYSQLLIILFYFLKINCSLFTNCSFRKNWGRKSWRQKKRQKIWLKKWLN